MLHFTCDLCGKELCQGHDHHFIVKMEVFEADDSAQITEADLEEDHLEAISELLSAMEDDDADCIEPLTKQFRYDLCHDCHHRFVRDPLNKEAVQKLGFSKN